MISQFGKIVIRRFVISKSMLHLPLFEMFRQHWPVGRAIFYTKNKDLVAWINHSDHLILKSLEKRGNVQAAASRLQSSISKLSKQLKFSKHEKLGYLTLKPINIGM